MIRKILAWICCFSVVLLLLTFFKGCTLVKKPAIRSAEFQFKLEYERNGNLIVVEDTLICKYKGNICDTSVGWHRFYDKYIKSNKRTKDIMLCELDDGLKLYYYTGYPAGYMGDTKMTTDKPFNVVYSSMDDDPESSRKFYNNNSYEDFGIKLISWTIDPPIENTLVLVYKYGHEKLNTL